jgi:hypothetical protein
MPFGKYQGRTLREVLGNPRYVLWLISLRKFEQEYPDLHAFFRKEAVEILVYWEGEKDKPQTP